MKRYLTLGISLCLLGFVSGCCCGGVHGCGFRRMRGCDPCGGACSGYAPQGVPFNGGYGAQPQVFGAQPGAYIQSDVYGTAALPGDITVGAANSPYVNGTPQAVMSPAVPFGEAPVTAALTKPESLATY